MATMGGRTLDEHHGYLLPQVGSLALETTLIQPLLPTLPPKIKPLRCVPASAPASTKYPTKLGASRPTAVHSVPVEGAFTK